MMEYKHKSGAQKRKEKANTLENDKIGRRTLFQFGIAKEKDKSEPGVNFPILVDSNELDLHEWLFREIEETDLEKKCSNFCKEYDKDVSSDLIEEVKHLKSIYSANIQSENLHPIELLNKLYQLKLEFLFPNIVIAIRIFCTIPVTVAEAERTFSKLKQIKSVQRSVMKQDRLNGLATLAIEHDLAKLLNYDDIINDFASDKARKVYF